jgi:hypothetical protein
MPTAHTSKDGTGPMVVPFYVTVGKTFHYSVLPTATLISPQDVPEGSSMCVYAWFGRDYKSHPYNYMYRMYLLQKSGEIDRRGAIYNPVHHTYAVFPHTYPISPRILHLPET